MKVIFSSMAVARQDLTQKFYARYTTELRQVLR